MADFQGEEETFLFPQRSNLLYTFVFWTCYLTQKISLSFKEVITQSRRNYLEECCLLPTSHPTPHTPGPPRVKTKPKAP